MVFVTFLNFNFDFCKDYYFTFMTDYCLFSLYSLTRSIFHNFAND